MDLTSTLFGASRGDVRGVTGLTDGVNRAVAVPLSVLCQLRQFMSQLLLFHLKFIPQLCLRFRVLFKPLTPAWQHTTTLHLTGMNSSRLINPVNGHIKTAEQQTIIQPYGDWYTCRWWVGCYIWYREEGTEWRCHLLRPSSLYHQRPVHQLHIIRCGTIITSALQGVNNNWWMYCIQLGIFPSSLPSVLYQVLNEEVQVLKLVLLYSCSTTKYNRLLIYDIVVCIKLGHNHSA